jgi:hypothetical protein
MHSSKCRVDRVIVLLENMVPMVLNGIAGQSGLDTIIILANTTAIASIVLITGSCGSSSVW